METNRELLKRMLQEPGAGIPGAALAIGSGMVKQAGQGLGTAAGMMGSVLRGERPDINAAADTARDTVAYQPERGGQAALELLGRGMEPVDRGMQAAAANFRPGPRSTRGDKLNSPLLAAGLYAGMNVLNGPSDDAARIAALRAVEASTPKGPAFRSAVMEAIPKLQPKATLQQYIDTLRNMKGIKGEELTDMGVDGLLETVMDPRVAGKSAANMLWTREQLAEQLKSQAPSFELGRMGFSEQNKRNANRAQEIIKEALASPEAYKALDEAYKTLGGGDYQYLPEYGGVFLLNHPENHRQTALARWQQDMLHNPVLREMAERKALEESGPQAAQEAGDMPGARYMDMRYLDNNPMQAGYQELLQQATPGRWQADLRGYTEPHFRRSHSEGSGRSALDNNIASHMRLEDVNTPEGGKGVLLNEVQSTYARDARKQGTTSEKIPIVSVQNALDAYKQHLVAALASGDASALKGAHFSVKEKLGKGPFDLNSATEAVERLSPGELLYSLSPHTKDSVNTASPLYTPGGSEIPALDQYFLGKPGGKPWEPYVNKQGVPVGRNSGTLAQIQKRQEQYQSGTEKGESRLPGLPGRKSWQLRALKTALRETVDRGGHDLYFPTGNMMPRIERWLPREDFDVQDPKAPGSSMSPEDADAFNVDEMKKEAKPHIPELDFESHGYWKIGDNLWESEHNSNRLNAEQVREEIVADLDNDRALTPEMESVMQQYDLRYPAEWSKYLKQFDAKIEPGRALPAGVPGDVPYAPAQRIKITPKLLAEILKGQSLYQVGGGAALLGLLAQQEANSNKENAL